MRPFLACALLVLLAPAMPAFAQPADLTMVPYVTGASAPMGVRNAGDGSNRLFVINRYGKIHVRLPGSGTAVLPTAFLDISSGAPFGFGMTGEGGFLGLAFDPNYSQNHYFYVHYSSADGDATVVRYTARTDNPNVADPASALVIFRADQDTGYHRGGDLAFGADGYLYISLGDSAGGNSYDGCNRAQSLTPADVAANDSQSPDCPSDPSFTGSGGNPDSRALLGKILRIDVHATTPAGSNELCSSNADGSANYAIPSSNPFAGGNGGAGKCDEIFDYGLRNPYRFSIDRATGDLLIGDVGESEMEEVDFGSAGTGGLNFGWDRCEGTVPTPGGSCSGAGFIAPILTYTHSDNAGPCAAITGGYRYRGSIGELQGKYVYADYCSGKILIATNDGGWSSTIWRTGDELNYTGFGEDEQGELYLAAINQDIVYRFVSDGTVVTHTVTPVAEDGGALSPSVPQTVNDGDSVGFTVTPDPDYAIDSVTGCGGNLSGNLYTTGAITADCTVTATFVIDVTPHFVVTPDAGTGGSLEPSVPQTVDQGDTLSFTVTPDGSNLIDTVTGCGGNLDGDVYTTAPITADCTVTATFTIVVDDFVFANGFD
ncbi:MAG: PQQ-dependent sugar dehydrogenase [Rhodanobacteraceae bacterium]